MKLTDAILKTLSPAERRVLRLRFAQAPRLAAASDLVGRAEASAARKLDPAAKARSVGYFGCIGHVGHMSHGGCPERLNHRNTLVSLDAGFLPRRPHDVRLRKQGAAKLTVTPAWTVLSFADRTIDDRGQSHSTFFTHGALSGDDMIAACRGAWPQVWARFNFDVEIAVIDDE